MRHWPRISSLLLALTAMLLHSLATPSAALAAPESAVVRITAKDGERNKTGTGFIVHIAADIVYIVTASHVIEGDDEPQIEFFTRRDRPVASTIKAAEAGDPKGLALLTVSGKQAIAPDLSALALDTGAQLKGGDEVMAIGFPRMGGDWAVSKGHLSARQGRELIFAMPVGEGNSGGPLIKDGKVVAIITGEAQGRAFAAAATSAKLFLEGSGLQMSAAVAVAPPAARKEKQPPADVSPGSVDAAQALALMGAGRTETNRVVILRELVRKRSLTVPLSAADAMSLIETLGDSNRATAIGILKESLASGLTAAEALEIMGEDTQESARFTILQYLVNAGRLKLPLLAEDAAALMERFHDNLRISAIAVLARHIAAGVTVEQARALMGAQEKEPVRHRVLTTLARAKLLKPTLSDEEKLQLVEGFGNNYRSSALQFLK